MASSRAEIVRLRLRSREKRSWLHAARLADKTLSEWLRDLANKDIALSRAGTRPPVS